MRLPAKSMEDHELHELKNITGKVVKDCYQCMKCSAGCTYIEEMKEPPHRIMMLVKLGLYQRALESETLWVCAACMACSARCPRDMEPAKIMEGLRAMALRENHGERLQPIYKQGMPQQAYIASMRKLRG